MLEKDRKMVEEAAEKLTEKFNIPDKERRSELRGKIAKNSLLFILCLVMIVLNYTVEELSAWYVNAITVIAIIYSSFTLAFLGTVLTELDEE